MTDSLIKMPNQDGSGRLIKNILISGAGPAGHCLAHWLTHYGFSPTVVERASAPRVGGYAIDLRGAAVTVAQRMGIMPALEQARVAMREIVMYDPDGDVVWRTDGNWGAGSGDIELLRNDLSNITMQAATDGVEYLYGTSIRSVDNGLDGVAVRFEDGQLRRFDLVIGCDGLHSKVRSLAFGPEEQFAHPLNLYVAIFRIENRLSMDRQMLMCTTPGAITTWLHYGHDKHTCGCIIVALPRQEYDRDDEAAQMEILRRAMADRDGWKNAELVDAMGSSSEFYFDEVTQIHMPSLSNGRVALVGDAGYAPTALSGQGTSLAVVGAYVLAGELAVSRTDHRVAFAHYDAEMRTFIKQNQQLALNSGEWFMPDSREELDRHNAAIRQQMIEASVEDDGKSYGEKTRAAARAIDLKDYDQALAER